MQIADKMKIIDQIEVESERLNQEKEEAGERGDLLKQSMVSMGVGSGFVGSQGVAGLNSNSVMSQSGRGGTTI